jgi:hypothetical protein
MRHILKRNIEKGLLPNYQDGAVELDKQFCTIGGIGMYEVMDMFGLIETDELNNKSYSDEAVEFEMILQMILYRSLLLTEYRQHHKQRKNR